MLAQSAHPLSLFVRLAPVILAVIWAVPNSTIEGLRALPATAPENLAVSDASLSFPPAGPCYTPMVSVGEGMEPPQNLAAQIAKYMSDFCQAIMEGCMDGCVAGSQALMQAGLLDASKEEQYIANCIQQTCRDIAEFCGFTIGAHPAEGPQDGKAGAQGGS